MSKDVQCTHACQCGNIHVPADPVKPVINSLLLSQSAMYSFCACACINHKQDTINKVPRTHTQLHTHMPLRIYGYILSVRVHGYQYLVCIVCRNDICSQRFRHVLAAAHGGAKALQNACNAAATRHFPANTARRGFL